MAFEKTQNKLDELRNLTWQNGKLIEQNQQLLDQLENGAGAIGSEIMVGKQSLVSAIEYKGGTSNADKSFQGIAEDIKEIPNFDQWARLAGVLAGNSYNKNNLQGHEENVSAGSITKLTDPLGTFNSLNNYAFQYWDLLEEIDLPYLIRLDSTKGFHAFKGCDNLKKINFPRLEFISNTSSQGSFVTSPFLTQIYLPELVEIKSGYTFTGFVEELICPKLQVLPTNSLLISSSSVSNIKNIVLGTLTTIYANTIHHTTINLRNITIGQGTDINLPFQQWTAKNVIAEGQTGIDELNSNLYNNLLTKLYDHSEDGEERTLRLGWYNYVSEENKLYAKNKGWNITT